MTLFTKTDNLKKLAATASILVASLLSALKFVAFLKTDSLSILSSFIDSITDIFASVISFVAVYFSTKPASAQHRYGFGKTEALSALLQAIFVGISGLFVISDGIKRFFYPVAIVQTNVGIFVMLLSILFTFFLVCFQLYVSKKTGSLAIKADMAHYTVDFLTNFTVVLSLLLISFFNFTYFDIIGALFISIYLLYNAYTLTVEAMNLLTDKELDPNIRKKIEEVVFHTKGIKGMHDFRSRNLGNVYYFEFHLEMDGDLTLLKAHKITELVENKIFTIYPNSQILIHQDPYGIRENRLDHEIDGICNIE